MQSGNALSNMASRGGCWLEDFAAPSQQRWERYPIFELFDIDTRYLTIKLIDTDTLKRCYIDTNIHVCIADAGISIQYQENKMNKKKNWFTKLCWSRPCWVTCVASSITCKAKMQAFECIDSALIEKTKCLLHAENIMTHCINKRALSQLLRRDIQNNGPPLF